MIKFRTLDGELVQFDNDLSVKTLDVDDEPYEFYRYFPSFDRVTGWEIYVAVLICVKDKPVWGVASCEEELDKTIVRKEGEELTEAQKSVLVNNYYDKSMKELQDLEMFVQIAIMPKIMKLIDEMTDDKLHIVDVRKMYVKDYERYGYYVSTYDPSPEV